MPAVIIRGHRLPALSCAVAGVVALGLVGCGSQGAAAGTQARSIRHEKGHEKTSSEARPRRSKLIVSIASAGLLPAATRDAAAVSLDHRRLVLLGGVDAADASTPSIVVLANGTVQRRDVLPEPQHDAQAARLGRYVYVFGGGVVSSFNHILRYDPGSGSVVQAGQLPTPASDVAVAALGGTAFVVGGYDGTNWLNSILAWRPGIAPQLAGRLPFGLRYAAVAAAGHRLIIAGGTTTSDVSDAILSFDPTSGATRRIGRLPVPLTHASAVWVDGRVLLVGGRREVSAGQTSAILAINPRSGAVRQVGRLPHPLSDAAVVVLDGKVLVAGGEDAAGPRREILGITPQITHPPGNGGP